MVDACCCACLPTGWDIPAALRSLVSSCCLLASKHHQQQSSRSWPDCLTAAPQLVVVCILTKFGYHVHVSTADRVGQYVSAVYTSKLEQQKQQGCCNPQHLLLHQLPDCPVLQLLTLQ
jgi:hypothetical protein